MVTELQSADQWRGDIRAQTGLISNQLLQTSDGKRVLGADVHHPYRETACHMGCAVNAAFCLYAMPSGTVRTNGHTVSEWAVRQLNNREEIKPIESVMKQSWDGEDMPLDRVIVWSRTSVQRDMSPQLQILLLLLLQPVSDKQTDVQQSTEVNPTRMFFTWWQHPWAPICLLIGLLISDLTVKGQGGQEEKMQTQTLIWRSLNFKIKPF